MCGKQPPFQQSTEKQLSTRQRTKTVHVRKFEIPSTLNLDATDIVNLIRWKDEIVYEPPLTQTLSNATLREFLKEPTVKHFAKFPCHTQAVERAVKMVTEASSSVCSAARRDGLIHSKLSSRSRNPSYTSKKTYNI